MFQSLRTLWPSFLAPFTSPSEDTLDDVEDDVSHADRAAIVDSYDTTHQPPRCPGCGVAHPPLPLPTPNRQLPWHERNAEESAVLRSAGYTLEERHRACHACRDAVVRGIHAAPYSLARAHLSRAVQNLRVALRAEALLSADDPALPCARSQFDSTEVWLEWLRNWERRAI